MRKRQKMMGQMKGDFRQRMRDKFDDKITGKDLYDSQKACQYLDESKGFDEPVVSWYWPPKPVEKKIKDDDEDDGGSSKDGLRTEAYESEEDEEEVEDEIDEDTSTPQEKLQQLTQYLRVTYHYCVWCGTSYEDAEDLQKNCPGSSHDDHN